MKPLVVDSGLKVSGHHIFITSFLLLLSISGIAQKKKKGDDTPTVSEMKAREAEFYFTDGEKYFILEDYAKALAAFQKALDIFPNNATIHYKIAEVLSHGSRSDDLIRASLSIEQALKLEQKNKYFYLLGADIYSNLNRYDRAIQLYESLLKEIEGTEEYLFELAALYKFSNKYQEAIKTYDRAEAHFGVNETSSLQKQEIYTELGKPDDAQAEAEKLVAAFPDDERYTLLLAEHYSGNKQTTKAIALLEQFMVESSSASTSVMLASLYRETGQESKARDLLQRIFSDPHVSYNSKLVILSTYSAELNSLKAKDTNDKNKEVFVLELFNKLNSDYPEEMNTHILGGDLYLSIGRNAEAEREYLNATRLGEVNFEVWQNILYLQIQRDAFDEVVNNAERALEVYPNQSMLYYFNGMAHLRKHRYREAITSLEMGKRLSASNQGLTSELNALLGDAYHGSKEYEKSDKAYDEALAFNPNNYIVLNNYSYYLALRKTSLDKAEKMAGHLIKNNPDNPTFLDTYAWVLYARQKFKDARKIIERAIATGKASATHFEHYGDILFRLGETDLAVQQWEKAKGMLNATNEILNKKIANRKIYE